MHHFYNHTSESVMLCFPLGLMVCCQTGWRRWVCREIKLSSGTSLPLGELISVLLASSAQSRTLQFCPELIFLRLPGSHVRSWETWQSWSLQEFPALQWAPWHPWGSQTLGSPPEMLSLTPETSSFVCLTTCITKPRWAISDCSFLVISCAYLQGAWEAKLNGDTQSQPPLHPVLQKSLCHPRLHQGTVMVSLSQLGLVLFLLLPSLMKLPTWYLYLLNNTYHHTTASFSTASPSPSYVPRAKHNQEGGKKWKEITISDPVLLRFQNCEGEKIYCSFPWKDGSYQKTLTTATALFMNNTLILLVLFIYAAETARCQTRRKIPDAEHMSKQS